MLDNATGDVLAYVGSSGELSRAAEVDGVVAPRQAGSTLKPFLYALALDAKLLTAASLVDDSPLAIATARGIYVPQNYDRDFHGRVSVRTALGELAQRPGGAHARARRRSTASTRRCATSGFDTLTQPADLLRRVAGAGRRRRHAARARQRVPRARERRRRRRRARARRPATPTRRPAPRRVFGPAASFIVTDILADRGARAPTFGLENPLATRVWSAVKTGTSKDMRDNWCVGFTARYTVGVWVGNFSGAPMHDVSGVTGAAPIWRDVVHWLHARDAPSVAPRARAAACCARPSRSIPPVEHARDEWFVARHRDAARARDRPPRRRDGERRMRTRRASAIRRRTRSSRSIPTFPRRTSASRSSPRLRTRDCAGNSTTRSSRTAAAARCGRRRPAGTRSRSSTRDGTVLSRVDFEVRGHAPARIARPALIAPSVWCRAAHVPLMASAANFARVGSVYHGPLVRVAGCPTLD